jgi:hypothetical protein
MPRLITIWLDLCLLRAGPQDLPVSQVLLWLSAGAYLLVSFLLSVSGYPPGEALLVALVDLGLLIAFAAALLYLWGKTERLNQTLTALAGSGALLGLIALPLVQVLFAGQEAGQVPPFIILLWFLLYGWSLLVVTHITRHALSISFPFALGIAIVYTLVAMQIIGVLFPVETP